MILDHRVRLADLRASEDVAFVAPERVLAPLAAAIGVERVLSCRATFHLDPEGEAVHVRGEVRAVVVQTCVVSLDSFESEIVEPIDVRFAPEGAVGAAPPPATDEEEGTPGMADLPEPIVGGAIDLGALAQEFLALGVDPYPRKPGVAFDPTSAGDRPASPFAALARLRTDPKDDSDR